MFNLYGNDRLIEWKNIRNNLEISQTPFQDVVDIWCKAPFVNPYLDPYDPGSWPDPWHLILDNKLDDLAIILGMQYTLQLTSRFMKSNFEIHMSTGTKDNDKSYSLRVEDCVLNLEYGSVLPALELKKYRTSIIWSSSGQK